MSRSQQQPYECRSITDRSALVGFGKFSQETVQDVLDNDPAYILWLDENTDIDIASNILTEAQDNLKPDHEFKGWSARECTSASYDMESVDDY